MKMTKASSQIEDLARLAREGCAYRGRSQQVDFPLPGSDEQMIEATRPLQRLIASVKSMRAQQY